MQVRLYVHVSVYGRRRPRWKEPPTPPVSFVTGPEIGVPWEEAGRKRTRVEWRGDCRDSQVTGSITPKSFVVTV